MQRRKFLVGLGSLAAGGAATMGTGAFDRVTADRDADIEVAPDKSALLNLTSGRDQYIDVVNGILRITLNGQMNNTSATGVNASAVTVINDLFYVSNNGDKKVEVVFNETQLNNPNALYWNDTTGSSSADTTAEFESGVEIPPGQNRAVGLYIDSHGFNPGKELAGKPNRVIIEANSV